MLLLFQTATGGYAIFKELDDQDLQNEFSTANTARMAFELKAFSKLKTISKATQETTLPISNRQARKRLRKFLRVHCHNETLGVADSKLRSIIKYKLKIDCVHNNDVMELMRDLRYQVTELVVCLASQNMAPMNLGLCHRLSIYQKKFNTDKVEAMIVQAIDLLSNNDIKLNEISVRLREQYGCHFPELSKITMDNIQYARTVKMMCECIDVAKHHFSKILSEEVETELKEASITSMGTEIGEVELGNIIKRCDEVLALLEYRATFYNDLKIRINAIIPDLIAMVEEIVGARLISRNSKTITEVASQLPNDASQCQIQTLNMIMMLFKR